MQRPMEPVVPRVLADEEDGNLHGHLPQGREGNAEIHAAHGGQRVKEPDLGELDGEMAEEDKRGAIESLLPCGNLLLCGCQFVVQAVSVCKEDARFESCTC